MPKDMLTSREVAAYLGIHEKQVYRLLRQGRLPGTRVIGRWVFSQRQVREWIEACARQETKLEGGGDGGDATTRRLEPHHLAIVGSDDLLLQILQREFNRRHPAMLVTSAAMSSEAGIASVRERRAHVAGVHLLDAVSGEYNRPQVAAAFAGKRALLVTLAHRQVGLMVPSGNPRGVRDLGDVVRLRLRMTRRQRGSGARVLQDHLLAMVATAAKPKTAAGRTKPAKTVKTAAGQTRAAKAVRAVAARAADADAPELATHLEVATAVAEGRADVGLGVMAPARSLGLDFVPLAWERYDLLTSDEAFYHRPTQAFFEMIKSDWLRQLVATLPGYDARDTGMLTVVQTDE